MIAIAPSHQISDETAQLLSTTETAKRLGVTVDTVLTWITNGVPINGKRIRLRAIRYGIRWKTKPEWLKEFAAQCSAPMEVNNVE